GSTSAKTGSRPFHIRALTVEQKVKLGTITSPAGHSRARHASVKPMSQLETQRGAGWSRMVAARCSSSRVYLPKLESIRDSNSSATRADYCSSRGNWGRVIGISADDSPFMRSPPHAASCRRHCLLFLRHQGRKDGPDHLLGHLADDAQVGAGQEFFQA